MSWGKYLSLFGLSTFKFKYTSLAAIAMGLTFLEAYLISIIGATFSATILFFMSDFFIARAEKKRKIQIEKAIKDGKELPQRKKFTRTNKIIVRIKRVFGIYGICLLIPLLLSVPLGTIIAVKFFRKDKRTFPLIILGILVNAFLVTSIVYINHIFK